jgi:hypothetical protein
MYIHEYFDISIFVTRSGGTIDVFIAFIVIGEVVQGIEYQVGAH